MIFRDFLRIPLITAAAVATVFALFTLMYSLVATDLAGLRDVSDSVRFDFVRLQKRELTPAQRKLPDKPQKPQMPQMPDTQSESESLNPDGMKFAASSANPYKLDLMTGGDLSKGWAGTRDPLPIMRVTPVYPSRASRRGIEGWVELAFTITTTGATEGVRVVSEEPPGVFGRAAMKAVRKWKYKPQVIDGKVQPRPDVRVVLKFELEK